MKVVILGAHGVGKTALALRFVKRNIPPDPEPTIGVSCSTTSVFAFQKYHRLMIMDLSGNDGYETLYRKYVQNAHVAVVVYDVTNKTTFFTAIKKIKFVQTIHDNMFPIILIGNKIDCISTRRVQTSEALGKVKSSGNVFFIETSALKGINTTDALKIISTTGANVCKDYLFNLNDIKNKDATRCIIV